MNVSESVRAILEKELIRAWSEIKDETLINEYFTIEENMPKGLILADKQGIWQNMLLKKLAIMNEFSKRFKNA